MMETTKRRRLERAGWRVGTADAFLGLTEAESALVEMRLALGEALRRRRASARMTQLTLAKRIRSSQSRVAKMEAGDPSVSLELLIRAHISLGATRRDVARVLVAAS